MQFEISTRQRALMFRRGMARVGTAESWVYPSIMALMGRWAKTLGPQKVALMVSIIHRTLGCGRGAEAITIKQITDGFKGSDEVQSSGLGVSDRTAQTHLEQLCDDDFIHIYTVTTDAKEHQARVFEINFKKVFDPLELEKVGLFIELIPLENGVPPENSSGVSFEYIYKECIPSLSSLRLDKSNHFSPVSDAAILGGGSMLATPKKQRAVTSRSDSITEVLQTTQAVSTTKRLVRSTRAAAAAPGALTKLGLQALIDTNMKKYSPGLPRVSVSDKNFGLFKKRFVTANVPLAAFIDYIVRYWSTLAVQNAKAMRKQGGMKTALDMAPNFFTLATRLPYFLSCYGNHVAGLGASPTESSASDRKIAELKKALAQSQQANAQLLSRRRTEVRKTQGEESVTAAKPFVPTFTSVFENDDDLSEANNVIPEWDAPVATTTKIRRA